MLVSIATNVSIFRITAIVSRGFFHFGFMDFIFQEKNVYICANYPHLKTSKA